MIKYLLFDLDNTLYSSSYGLEDNVRQRIQEFIAAFLGLSIEEAWKQRRERAGNFSTALEWLMLEKGFADPEAYLSAVHPPDEADSLPPNPQLRAFLEGLPFPKAILTNSPMEHANRILDKLGVQDLFTHIFDIRFGNYGGKPHSSVFLKALDVLGVGIDEVLFIDDFPRYVQGFIDIGGKGLLLDENNFRTEYPHPRIQRLEELTEYL